MCETANINYAENDADFEQWGETCLSTAINSFENRPSEENIMMFDKEK